MIFSISTTDLSNQVNSKKSYKMNSTRMFTSVTDADGVEYRNYYRGRVAGSFDMYFIDKEENDREEQNTLVSYADFLTLLEQNTANGVLLCTVWVQNKAVTATINCFCDVTMKKESDVNGYKVRIVNVKIQEC